MEFIIVAVANLDSKLRNRKCVFFLVRSKLAQNDAQCDSRTTDNVRDSITTLLCRFSVRCDFGNDDGGTGRSCTEAAGVRGVEDGFGVAAGVQRSEERRPASQHSSSQGQRRYRCELRRCVVERREVDGRCAQVLSRELGSFFPQAQIFTKQRQIVLRGNLSKEVKEWLSAKGF